MKKVFLLICVFLFIVALTGCASEISNTSSDPITSSQSIYVSEKTDVEENGNGSSITQVSSAQKVGVLPPEVTGKTLIGWWAEEPGIPSGEPPAYRFYENGEYRFSTGELMTDLDTDHRNDEYGFWILNDHTIELTVAKKDNKALENHEKKVIELTIDVVCD